MNKVEYHKNENGYKTFTKEVIQSKHSYPSLGTLRPVNRCRCAHTEFTRHLLMIILALTASSRMTTLSYNIKQFQIHVENISSSFNVEEYVWATHLHLLYSNMTLVVTDMQKYGILYAIFTAK